VALAPPAAAGAVEGAAEPSKENQMPYLEFLFCEHCGNHANLDLDPAATLDAYSHERRKKVFINPATIIWDYLIYTCTICGRKYQYTYQDVERHVREYFCSLSEEFKEYFDGVGNQSDGSPYKAGEGVQEPTGAMITAQKQEVAERVRRLYMKK